MKGKKLVLGLLALAAAVGVIGIIPAPKAHAFPAAQYRWIVKLNQSPCYYYADMSNGNGDNGMANGASTPMTIGQNTLRVELNANCCDSVNSQSVAIYYKQESDDGGVTWYTLTPSGGQLYMPPGCHGASFGFYVDANAGLSVYPTSCWESCSGTTQ